MKCLHVLFLFAPLMLTTGCVSYFGTAEGGGAGKGLPYGVSHGALLGDVTYPCFINSKTVVNIDSDDFDIIQTVTAESSSVNILGIVGTGDNGYGALFKQAQDAGADDVINVKADTRTQSVLGTLYKRSTTIMSGTAIRWKKK